MPTSIVKKPELAARRRAGRGHLARDRGEMKDLMIEVVRSGTGMRPRSPASRRRQDRNRRAGPGALEPGQTLEQGEDPPQEENAWFTAFAPADKPELAVAAIVIDATGGGGGGAVAAPDRRSRSWRLGAWLVASSSSAGNPIAAAITTSAPPTTAIRPPTVSFSSARPAPRPRARRRLRGASTTRRPAGGARPP